MALSWAKNPFGTWGPAAKAPAPENIEYFSVRSKAKGNHRLEHRVSGTKLMVITDEPVEDGGLGTAPNPMECMIAAVVSCDWEQACVVMSEKKTADCLLHDMKRGEKKTADFCQARGEFLVNLDGYVGKQQLVGAQNIPWVSIQAAWDSRSVQASPTELQMIETQVTQRCPMHRLLADAGCQVDVRYWSGSAFPGPKSPPKDAAKGATVCEKMGLLSVAGPQYHMKAVRAEHDAPDTRPGQGFVVAEPEEDGGTGAGANPMHHLMAALTGCLHEQAIVVAEELRVEGWGHVVWNTSFDVNLDGYLGVAAKHGVKRLPANAVFLRVAVDAEFTTSATQEQIDAVKALTMKRCPITGIFRAAGIQILGVWSKKL